MATMAPWSRVRVAKCQMLVTSFFVLLLGLSVATLAALTYFGAHFAVIGRASSNRTPYQAMHRWAFYTTSSLAGLLALGAVLGAVATVREAGGLMAGAFLCFALVFGALVQAAFWGFHNRTQVEDAVLDVYDLVYERAVRNLSGTPRQQLVAIQDTFLCCGKSSPFSLLGDTEASLCRGQQAARQVRRRGPDPALSLPRPSPARAAGCRQRQQGGPDSAPRSFTPSAPHPAPAWGSPRPGLPSEASRSTGKGGRQTPVWRALVQKEPGGHSREGTGRVGGRQRQGRPVFPRARRGAWHLPQPPPSRAPLPRCPLSGKQTHPYLWARGSWPSSNIKTGGYKWLPAQQGRAPTQHHWPQKGGVWGGVQQGGPSTPGRGMRGHSSQGEASGAHLQSG
ncbi:tetraspanin-32 isoform X1 [Meles meles]|uniref:tetraspanin-32 isoform X1 n=1 Tax=Meles meles TaxID=9662 RepID=UPI001E69FCB6|nr:tetraspanin-32 isoform X1 [Meles meles]